MVLQLLRERISAAAARLAVQLDALNTERRAEEEGSTLRPASSRGSSFARAAQALCFTARPAPALWDCGSRIVDEFTAPPSFSVRIRATSRVRAARARIDLHLARGHGPCLLGFAAPPGRRSASGAATPEEFASASTPCRSAGAGAAPPYPDSGMRADFAWRV